MDFASSNALKRYYRLRAAARTETKLGYLGRSNEAYLAAMKWVVAHSDVLVAAWDGLPPVDVGGTGDAVNQAILRHRAWVHLNVIDQSVSFHSLDILGNGLDRKSL